MGEIADEVQLISHDTKSRILQEAKTLIKQKSFKNGLNFKKKKKYIFIWGSDGKKPEFIMSLGVGDYKVH